MDQQATAEGAIQQYALECCVCSGSVKTNRARTCRNPTCLQTLCSVRCGIVHNWHDCPSDKEIKARVTTILNQAHSGSDGRRHQLCEGVWWCDEPTKRDVHRSRPSFRSATPHPYVVSHTHVSTTSRHPAIPRGRPQCMGHYDETHPSTTAVATTGQEGGISRQ